MYLIFLFCYIYSFFFFLVLKYSSDILPVSKHADMKESNPHPEKESSYIYRKHFIADLNTSPGSAPCFVIKSQGRKKEKDIVAF